MCPKIARLKLLPHLPGANEFKHFPNNKSMMTYSFKNTFSIKKNTQKPFLFAEIDALFRNVRTLGTPFINMDQLWS